MKSRSHRYDVNRSRPRHEDECTKYKMSPYGDTYMSVRNPSPRTPPLVNSNRVNSQLENFHPLRFPPGHPVDFPLPDPTR